MTSTGFPTLTTRTSYWQVSRAPRYSLLFAIPLLVFYQVLALLLAHGERSIRTAGISATVAVAAVFSAFHDIGPYGDRWQLYSFAFRMVAGLFFSALYLVRGFGITAWTHALYDVLLLLMQ